MHKSGRLAGCVFMSKGRSLNLAAQQKRYWSIRVIVIVVVIVEVMLVVLVLILMMILVGQSGRRESIEEIRNTASRAKHVIRVPACP